LRPGLHSAPATAALLALLALAPEARAGDPAVDLPLSHRVWKTEHGLPTNTVHALQTTRDGFLWIGTEEGLVRFDGVEFRRYHTGNEPAFRDNLVAKLVVTPDGVLWIGSQSGGLLRRAGDHFEAVGPAEGFTASMIRTLGLDGRGRLLVVTRDAGLLVREDEHFQPHPFPAGGGAVQAAAVTPDGAAWIATTEKQLLASRQGGWQAVAATAGRLIHLLEADAEGTLWAAAVGGGLWRHLTSWPGDRFEVVDAGGLGQVNALVPLPGGGAYLGTAASGLHHFDGTRARPVAAVDLLPRSLAALHADVAGNLWAGTYGQGLHLIRHAPVSAFTTAQGLADDVVNSVCEDPQGVIWAGGQDGRVTRIEGGRATVHALPGKPDWVTSVLPRRGGGIWVGTISAGLHALDARGRPALPEGLSPALLPRSVYALLEDPDGTLWVGGRDGLVALRPGAPWSRSRIEPDPLSVFSLARDRRGRLLVGSGLRGLGVLETGAGSGGAGNLTFTTREDGLSSEFVTSVLPAPDVAWVGTQGGGLNRVTDRGVAAWRARDGLWNDTVGPLVEDGEGRLWSCTNFGIYHVRAAELLPGARVRSVPLGRDEGMYDEECNFMFQPSGWRARDGRIWFATSGGLAVVDPRLVSERAEPPPVVVDAAWSDGSPVELAAPVRLGTGSGRLTVQYLAPALAAGRRVRYRYRLAGFDREWTEAGTRREATYTNLQPGRYTFEVEAAWQGREAVASRSSLAVWVPAAYYQTWWFAVLCLAATGGVAWWVVEQRLHQLRARNELLSERNRLGMELHDHLSQLMTGQLLQVEAARHALAHGAERASPYLDRAAQLAREGIEETRRTIWGLRAPSSFDRDRDGDGLAERLVRTLMPLTEGTGVKLAFQQQGQAFALPPGTVHELFRVGQEAVTNAIRHGQARRIELSLVYERRWARLRVSDDGQGFEPRAAEAAGGLGLTGMAERMRQLGGDLELRSSPSGGTWVQGSVPRRRWYRRRWFR
jgi:signal transduction histidine kinase/ligand-binding sensor domain-containing protein